MVRLVEPKVFKIAETKLNIPGLWEFAKEIGPEAKEWWTRPRKATLLAKYPNQFHDWNRAMFGADCSRCGAKRDSGTESQECKASRTILTHYSDSELLIEASGRLCYKSFGVGLNPNITMVRDDTGEYFRNILEKGDGSILEHGTVTFAVLGGSRVFTHELVRHRVGVAYSQESLRYVRPKEIGVTVMPGHEGEEDLDGWNMIEHGYMQAVARINWDNIGFDEKKRLTSKLRRRLPQGMATDIIFTANHRTLRWLIEARTHPSAEIEIRTIFDQIAEILIKDYPLIYQDFESTDNPDGTKTWKPTLRSKV